MPNKMYEYWSKEYDKMKEERNKKSKLINFIKNNITFNIFVIVALGIFALLFAMSQSSSNKQIKELSDSMTKYKIHTEKQISSLNDKIVDLQKDNLDLITENVELNKDKEKVLSYIDNLDSIKETYSYALLSGEESTDITNSELLAGVNIMNDKKIDPHLLFGIIMAESMGNKNLENKETGQRGYGQLTEDNAKWLYEVQLSNGENTYNHDILFDGKENIILTANYINFLMKKNNGDVYKTCMDYGGEVNGAYYNTINDIIESNSDTSLEKIGNTFKEKHEL